MSDELIGGGRRDTIHVLHQGEALCGKPGPPGSWHGGHRWIALSDPMLAHANCKGCLRAIRLDALSLPE